MQLYFATKQHLPDTKQKFPYQKIDYHNSLHRRVRPRKHPAHGLHLFLLKIFHLSLIAMPLPGDCEKVSRWNIKKRRGKYAN